MIGETLGHYRILDRLGAGGMGVVYLAHDERLDRRVALKVLSSDEKGRERLERLRREARSLASVNHRNIVTVYSVEEVDGTWFVTMELVRGETLDRMIPETGLSIERFFELAIPMAEAIAAAHQSGITHRDLKPSNVMLSERGEVKVLDFGLAKRTAATEADDTAGPTELLSREGAVVGTVPYMSPEQLTASRVDHRSDIFSLGVVYYQMLTGRRPFRGSTSAELISSIMRDPPEALHRVREGLPAGIQPFVERCLSKVPEGRFQRTTEVVEALRALARGEEATGPVTALSPGNVAAAASGRDGASRLSELRLGLLSARTDHELRKLEAEIAAFVAGNPTSAEGLMLQEDIASAHARHRAAAAPSRSPRGTSSWMQAAAVLFLVVGSGALFVGVLRQRNREPAPMAATAPVREPVESPSAAPAVSATAVPAEGGIQESESTPPSAQVVEGGARAEPRARGALAKPLAPRHADTPGPSERVASAPAASAPPVPAQSSPVLSAPTIATLVSKGAEAEVDEVGAVIERYRSAWSELDPVAIHGIHPSAKLTADDLRPYASAVLEIGTCAIEIEGDSAVARCPVVRTLIPRSTPQSSRPDPVVTRNGGFRLTRQGGQWRVVELLSESS
jgi:hypothetical protein